MQAVSVLRSQTKIFYDWWVMARAFAVMFRGVIESEGQGIRPDEVWATRQFVLPLPTGRATKSLDRDLLTTLSVSLEGYT
jgi:hypothetical protein